MKAIKGMGRSTGARSKMGKLCLIAGGMLSVSHAAQAQTAVQVYGLVDSYIGSIKRSDQPMATSVVNGGGTATSFWGIRGTEDLGGGMKAIFVLESFFQSDTGAQGRNTTDPLFSKDSYVGLNGKYGQITMGRHTIPLFNALVAGNPFGGSLQFSPVMLQSWLPTYGRNVAADSKWDNSVQYTTPELAGFKTTLIGGAGTQHDHHASGQPRAHRLCRRLRTRNVEDHRAVRHLRLRQADHQRQRGQRRFRHPARVLGAKSSEGMASGSVAGNVVTAL